MTEQQEEEVRKGAHCACQIHYHIVFPEKYCKTLLDAEVTAIIQETATEVAERFPIEMEAIGTGKNHIHLLCSAHPKMAPGRIVQVFMNITAREIFRRKPAVERGLWGGGGYFWTDGIMWRRWGRERTGRPSNGTYSGKGNPVKISSNPECFSSVIARQPASGSFIDGRTRQRR